jgi:hypothetical protein
MVVKVSGSCVAFLESIRRAICLSNGSASCMVSHLLTPPKFAPEFM